MSQILTPQRASGEMIQERTLSCIRTANPEKSRNLSLGAAPDSQPHARLGVRFFPVHPSPETKNQKNTKSVTRAGLGREPQADWGAFSPAKNRLISHAGVRFFGLVPEVALRHPNPCSSVFIRGQMFSHNSNQQQALIKKWLRCAPG